jgi:hypothetical protein
MGAPAETGLVENKPAEEAAVERPAGNAAGTVNEAAGETSGRTLVQGEQPQGGLQGGLQGYQQEIQQGQLLPGQEGSVYDKMFEMLEKRKTERERDRKRERRSRLMYAIGDGISAISGLVTAARSGAPSSYDAKQNMSTAAQERWDRYHKEKADDEREYLSDYLKILQAKRADEIATTNNWYKQQQLRFKKEKLEGDLALLKARAEDLAAQGKVREADAVLREWKAKAEEARYEGIVIDNAYKPDRYEADIAQKRAAAARSQSAADKTARDAGKTVESEEWEDDNGNKHKRVTTTPSTPSAPKKALPKGKRQLP